MAHWQLKIANWLTVCRREVGNIVRKIVTPVSSDEDDRRKEVLLRIVLVASLSLGVTCFAIVLNDTIQLGETYRGVPWWGMALVPGWFLFLFLLLQRGFLRLASAGLFLAYLIPSLYCSARWGIDLPQALLSDAFLIVMTGVLFGTRAAFVATLGISAALLSFSWLGTEGILPVNRYWHEEAFTLGDGIAIVGTLLFMSLLSQLAHREIERSLQRARTSEALLRQERDLLEIRVTERTRELRQTQLEQITQLHRFVDFGRMTTSFVHDLASPLGALALNLELLKKAGDKGNQKAAVYLERASSLTNRLETFLKDIRRHVRESESENEHFSANEVLTSVLEVVEYHARKAAVVLECQVQGDISIAGNAIRFHKVLMNLIWNAVDAYSGLSFEAKDRKVNVDIRQVGQDVVVSVNDHGCGIPPADLERIWEPFYTTKPSSQGMGIGLTVCRRVIEEDFRGTIRCSSTPEAGTTFTITLHAYEATAAKDQGTPPPTP